MRALVITACVAACVHRLDTTQVTLRDPSAVTTEGSGTLIRATNGDFVLIGRPPDVLAYDGDTLHMHPTRDNVKLRLDTPLANVRSIRAVGVVGDQQFIPLGLVAGSVLTGFGAADIAYEAHEHVSLGTGPAPYMLAFGVGLLAVEIYHRLARDTVTVVR
jgi:hypothetical protein